MKFSDMEYIRPDKEKIIADIVRATERLASAGSFEEADAALMEYEDVAGELSSMCTIATVSYTHLPKGTRLHGRIPGIR